MKLLVVDDHPLVRQGIRSILSSNKYISELLEADSISGALEIIANKRPNIVLVDLKLGSQNGFDLVEKAKESNSDAKFIILTSYLLQEDFLRGEKIGVEGYILKEAFAEDILYAIRLVQRGKKYYDPAIIGQRDKMNEEGLLLSTLTERESEVLREIGKGMTNEAIAKKLFISEHTVKKHVSSILSKLGLSHRTEAALFVNKVMKIIY
ncbi:MAG: response regulator transcription factor [Clostridiaceae bacterium]|nr:response regulator transcription factor [Clostridiaceae bacterium]